MSLVLAAPVIGACTGGTEGIEGGAGDAAEPDSVHPDLPSDDPLADPFGEDPALDSEWWAGAPTTTTWGGGTVAAPLPLACLRSPSVETCCAPNQSVWIGTDGADTLLLGLLAKPGRCAFAEAGDDHLRLTALQDFVSLGDGNDTLLLRGGGDAALGGPGNDTLVGGLGGDTLYGQAGDDLLQPGAGNDFVDAGEGDDSIDCSAGDDVILPGPGRDDVWGGPGDDDVWIASLCEVEPGEVLRGGLGHDTLHTPVPISDLLEAGAVVEGFETIDLLADNLPSACEACESSADCTPERPICQGGGTTGGGYCACEPRFTGPSCDQCAPGYEGADCLECAEGYVQETPPTSEWNVEVREPEERLPIPTREFVCLPDDTTACATSPGGEGLDCGDHGTCLGTPPQVGCACDEGYTGASCEACAPGYERDSTDACVLGGDCATSRCNGNGQCVLDATGALTCQCEAGFSDPDCGDDALELVSGVDGFTSVRAGEATLLQARRRDGSDEGVTYTWTFTAPDGTSAGVVSPAGALLACPTSYVDPDTGAAVRCTDPRDVIFVAAPAAVGDVAAERSTCIELSPGPAGLGKPITQLVVPQGWLPITTQRPCKPGQEPFFDNVSRFVLARGVRAASVAISRDADTPVAFGVGYRNRASLEDGVAEPFVVAANIPPASVEKQWRVTPNTPFRIGSITKPIVAGALRHYAALTGYDMDEPGVVSELVLVSMGEDGASFSYNSTEEPFDAWEGMTLHHVLWHRAGWCRLPPFPGQPTSVDGTPPAQPPLVSPLLTPMAADNDGDDVFAESTRQLWVGDYDGVRTTQPLGDGATDIARQRGFDLNEVLWWHRARAKADPTYTPPAALFSCRDAGDPTPCWSAWVSTHFLLGTRPVYSPGTAGCVVDVDGRCVDGSRWGYSQRCATLDPADSNGAVYSNAVYSLAGRLMEAMIGVEWAYDGGANAPDGWGPVAEILRAYLAGEGTDVNRAFAFDPVAARQACGANPNASNQPCYRELDPDTGAEIQQYDWIQPWRYRIAQVMPNQLRWQFCQSEVQSECETDNTLWSASPNAAAAYAIDGYYSASGLVWTMPELVRYARGHVMTGGSGDDRGGNFDETSADYQQRSRAFTGASDIDVSLTFGIPRIQGGHGGGLRGTRAGVRRYRSGEDLAPKIEIPRFVRGSPNDVWNLDGPRLGSTAVEAAYVKPWVATPLPPGFVGTPVPPPSCKLTANTDYVWSLNQGNDPSNNSFASSKDGAFTAPSDDNKKNDIDAYTVMGRLIEDAICQCEESTCW